MYFKITNKEENHHGFQYQDGLNILVEEFNDDPDASCCSGGFYFTDVAHIFKFLDFGIYLRQVSLPTDDKDFKMLKDKGDKWRSNMIILGERHDLSNVNTFKFLVAIGADIHVNDDCALRVSARYGYLDVVKYLIEQGAAIDFALKWSAPCGHLDVVKFLVENGADIHADDDLALRSSAHNGYLDVVKFLVEKGANIHADDDYALQASSNNGHLDVVMFLVENGADIHTDNDLALRWSAEYGHLDIVEFLFEHGASICTNDNYALIRSTKNGHTNVSNFLISKGAKNLI